MSAVSGNRILVVAEALAGFGVVAAIIGKNYGPAPTVAFTAAAMAAAFAAWMIGRAVHAWGDETLDVEGKTKDAERERLEEEKHVLLQGIKELEADTAAGKVDRRDYDHLRATAEDRAMDIIETLKNDDAKWRLEAERYFEKRTGHMPLRRAERTTATATAPPTATATAAAPALATATTPAVLKDGVEPADAACFDDRPIAFEANACTGCAQGNEADARYCIGCGRPRAGAAP